MGHTGVSFRHWAILVAIARRGRGSSNLHRKRRDGSNANEDANAAEGHREVGCTRGCAVFQLVHRHSDLDWFTLLRTATPGWIKIHPST
jgi:hypothetical protein